MTIFTVNNTSLELGGVTVRKLHGRDWWVAPMVPLREGVYQGSKGAIMYPAAENKRTAKGWNNVPLVVNHPQDPLTGQYTSARTSEVLEERGVGMVLNARDVQGDLKAEGWFDPARTAVVEPRLHAALEAALNGKPAAPINVSTGLGMLPLDKPGTHKGMVYNTVASAYEPDHVAILMDVPGACSTKHGCGLFVNSGEGDPLVVEEPGDLRLTSDPAMVANASSFDEITEALRVAMDGLEPMLREYGYIEAVYPDKFVFRYKKKFYEQRYTMDAGVAKLAGTMAEVIREVLYKPAPAITANTNGADKNMSKATMIAAILAAGGNWGEADKPTLEAMDEAVLGKIAPAAATAPVTNAGTCGCGGKPAPAPAAPAPVAPAPADSALVGNAWRNQVPPEVLQALDDAVVTTASVRETLVANIGKCPANKFTQDQLKAMSTPDLRNLEALATAATAPAAPVVNGYNMFDYRAAAGAPPVTNAAAGKPAVERKPLSLPSTL